MSCNGIRAKILSHDKFRTNEVLRRNGIPVPASVILPRPGGGDDRKVRRRLRRMRFPVVVKPIKGQQGHSVHTNLRSVDEVIRTASKFRDSSVLVEEQVSGRDYRVLIHRGTVVDVLERVFATVTGDGESTVDELVAKYNAEQAARGSGHYPVTTLSPSYVWDCHRLRMTDVPPRGLRVQVTQVGNHHNGAAPRVVNMDDIHPSLPPMWLRCAKLIGTDLVGLDFMGVDITASPEGHVIELNAGPSFEIHAVATPLRPGILKHLNSSIPCRARGKALARITSVAVVVALIVAACASLAIARRAARRR